VSVVVKEVRFASGRIGRREMLGFVRTDDWRDMQACLGLAADVGLVVVFCSAFARRMKITALILPVRVAKRSSRVVSPWM